MKDLDKIMHFDRRFRSNKLLDSDEETGRPVTVEDFWKVVETLPNEIEGKDMKKLLKEYFHPDGKSKKKQEDFVTDEQLQEWNAVGMFAIKVVGQRMRVAQSKEYKEQRKQEAKERKEANRERHQLARGGRSVEES